MLETSTIARPAPLIALAFLMLNHSTRTEEVERGSECAGTGLRLSLETLQLLESSRFLFPCGSQLRQLLLNAHQFPVDFKCSAGLFVGLGFFEFCGEFLLPRFQVLDFLFELMNTLLLRLALARARVAMLGLKALLFLP